MEQLKFMECFCCHEEFEPSEFFRIYSLSRADKGSIKICAKCANKFIRQEEYKLPYSACPHGRDIKGEFFCFDYVANATTGGTFLMNVCLDCSKKLFPKFIYDYFKSP